VRHRREESLQACREVVQALKSREISLRYFSLHRVGLLQQFNCGDKHDVRLCDEGAKFEHLGLIVDNLSLLARSDLVSKLTATCSVPDPYDESFA
jgi:hypothetical protein